MQIRHTLSVLLALSNLSLAAQQPAPQAAKAPNIPDTFTNLIVLPSTITKPELMTIMKQFATTFKVRCSYCHEVSDDLSEGNFASDAKPNKTEARKLMSLIQKSTSTMKP